MSIWRRMRTGSGVSRIRRRVSRLETAAHDAQWPLCPEDCFLGIELNLRSEYGAASDGTWGISAIWVAVVIRNFNRNWVTCNRKPTRPFGSWAKGPVISCLRICGGARVSRLFAAADRLSGQGRSTVASSRVGFVTRWSQSYSQIVVLVLNKMPVCKSAQLRDAPRIRKHNLYRHEIGVNCVSPEAFERASGLTAPRCLNAHCVELESQSFYARSSMGHDKSED